MTAYNNLNSTVEFERTDNICAEARVLVTELNPYDFEPNLSSTK